MSENDVAAVSSDLKPCPFCGGDAYECDCASAVKCSKCGAFGANFSEMMKRTDIRMNMARKSWNNRIDEGFVGESEVLVEDGKLKPCPFCGGAGSISEIEYEHDVYDPISLGWTGVTTRKIWVPGCRSCNANVGEFSSIESAIEGWNGRIEESCDDAAMP